MSELTSWQGWSEEQRTNFYYQMGVVQKDEVLGVILAVFLGSFGAHHFYLRRNGLGILYVIFFWTGIPGLAGVIEAFFMPERVRRFNAEQAVMIAGSLGPPLGPPLAGYTAASVPPAGPVVCPTCQATVAAGARFCARCGTTVVA